MPILLLQKPARKSKAKDHITYLERLETWQEGDLNELLREGRTIQQRLSKASPPFNKKKIPRSFANLIFQVKTIRLMHFAYSLSKVREEFSMWTILLKLRMGKER